MNNKLTKTWGLKQKEEFAGYMFILPFVIGFAIFTVAPFAVSVVMAFTDIGFVSRLDEANFVGLDNFINSLKDTSVLKSIGRSFYYSVLLVPAMTIISLLAALFINSRIYARNVIRTALFIPYVATFAATSIVWRMLFDIQDGPINKLLMSLGVSNPPWWLLGVNTVIPTIVIIVVWQGMGFNMIVYLSALQGVSEDLYEAAEIDGAGKLKKFLSITLPLISPTTLFVVITTIISSFQNFGIIEQLTRGGPGEASYTLSVNIYREAFSNYRIGYATAQAFIMFAIIFVFSLISLKGEDKFVNY